MRDKPFAPACERNKAPILEVLRQYLTTPGKVLEIGSGTGQHAVYFSAQLPHIIWQPSDQPYYLEGIRAWRRDFPRANLRAPVALTIDGTPWPVQDMQWVYTANTLHIMSWPAAQQLLRDAGRYLPAQGLLLVYGPFKYDGRHTSASNVEFDAALRARDPLSGIRDVAELEACAQAAGLRLLQDHAMPANNRLLVWRKEGG